MELDDLRRHWQQQPTGSSNAYLTTEQSLRTMLASSASTSPLRRLKKNASRELAWVGMTLVLGLFNALVFAQHLVSLQRLLLALLLLLCVVGLIVYKRLQIIRQMEHQSDNLYHFLKSRIAKFRQLMRIHDYLGVVGLTALALIGLLVRQADLLEYLQPANPDWGWHLGVAGGGLVMVLAVIYAGYAVGKREHQWRYGQYLDQLETALRELEEPQ
jgi:uncharacterized membrane protein YdcZ (DUF606 family)